MIGKTFEALDRARKADYRPGAGASEIPGAGWSTMMDPVLRTDAEQQALWGSVDAKYGRVTTSYGPTPQSMANSTGTEVALERIAATHWEADRTGFLYNKADMDFQVNRRDSHVYASMRARLAPLYRSELQFAPANSSPLAQAVAQIVRTVAQGIPGFSGAEEEMGTACAHGYAGLEIVWRTPRPYTVMVDKSTITLKAFKSVAALEHVHPRDFRWAPIKRKMYMDAGGNRYIDPFLNPDGSASRKLILHVGAGVGDPHQRGFDWCVAPLHSLKHTSVAKWAIVLEHISAQTPYMQYEGQDVVDDNDVKAASTFLSLLGRGKTALLHKKFGEVKLTPQAQGVDARGQHAAIVGVVNAEISKATQGQVLSMEAGGAGSYALANVQGDSKEEVQVIDLKRASDTFTHQLALYILEENLGSICEALGASPDQILACCPRAFRVLDRAMSPKDRLAMFVSVKNDLGYEIDPAQVESEFNIRITGKGKIQPKAGAEQAKPTAGQPKPEAQPEKTGAKIELTSPDVGAIVTVDEARQSMGLAPKEDGSGAATVAEYKAANAETVAAAAQAEDGQAPGEDGADPAPGNEPVTSQEEDQE